MGHGRPTRNRRMLLFMVLATAGLGPGCAASGPAEESEAVLADSARSRLERAVAAMGGEEELRALEGIRLEGIEHMGLTTVTQPARPPRYVYRRFTELRDVAGGRFRRTEEVLSHTRPDPIESSRTVTEGSTAEDLALAPERLLLTALEAPDLTSEPDTVMYGIRAHVVAFGGDSVRVFLDAATDLPLAWETVRAFPWNPFGWEMWGDVRIVTHVSTWSLEPSGLRYPRRLEVTRNGVPHRSTMIHGLDLAATAADSFPAEPGAARQPPEDEPIRLGNGRGEPPRELAHGIVFVPGQYNVIMVRQEDGVIILEAPHTAAYSREVIEEADRRFPDLPIKAVVSTSFLWPHIGGIREYIARGVPVHAPPRMETVMGRVSRAPHEISPDSLARAPRPLHFNAVDRPTVLGTGANRIELYPGTVSGAEHGEDMLAVYFPEHALLYGGDLYLPQRFEPNMWLQPLSELVGVVERYDLAVDEVFAIHIEPRAWAEAVRAVPGTASPRPVESDR